MAHATHHGRQATLDDPGIAIAIAAAMRALATPSRVRILLRLRDEPCGVTRLAREIGMEQSAVSHQLRMLRDLGLVVGIRDGRVVQYALHDDHVAGLLDEAISHTDHVRLGLANHPKEGAP